jgi:inosine-uridine nucleoside N-ribohydrolase
MVQEAHKTPTNQKLNVVVLGDCINVASVIFENSTIVPKISVYYIGLWYTVATNHYDKKQFNTDNDPLAVELLWNTEGLDFNVMTATTCQHLVFEKSDVDGHLKGKCSLTDYLVYRCEPYTRWWTDEDPEKKR